MADQEVSINNIKMVTMTGKHHDVDELVELFNIGSMIIYTGDKRIELYDKEDVHVATFQYRDYVDWTEIINGNDVWWEIDTVGFIIEVEIEEDKNE